MITKIVNIKRASLEEYKTGLSGWIKFEVTTINMFKKLENKSILGSRTCDDNLEDIEKGKSKFLCLFKGDQDFKFSS